MKRKTKGYLLLGICGIMMLLSAALLGKKLSDLGTGVLCGVGSIISFLRRVESGNPAGRNL